MLPAKVILSVLLDLTQKFVSDLALEEVLKQVTDAAITLLPGDHASVRVFDDSATELLCSARSGAGAASAPATFHRGEGILGWVAENGRVANIRDTAEDPRFLRLTDQGFTVRAIVAVPLLSAGRVIGVLAATSPQVDVFSAEDEALALLLANCTVPLVEKARLERLAMVDGLTLAYNERYLFPRVADEIERSRRSGAPLSLVLLDLDRLRRVNQTHGFGAGDQVLRLFADRVRSLLAGSQRLIRRDGGTFVVLLPEMDRNGARFVAEAIRLDMTNTPVVVEETLPVAQSVSLGLVSWDGSEGPAVVLMRAERALREAKQAGGNRLVVS